MLTAYKNFSPFFCFIAKTRPEPSFFTPWAFQPPKQNIFISLYILVHINSHSKYKFSWSFEPYVKTEPDST